MTTSFEPRADSRLTTEQLRAHVAAGEWEDRTLRSLLDDAVGRHPERLAVATADGRDLTYRELDDAVARLAAGLRAAGVDTGHSVVVMLPNCVEFVVAIYAILEVGAVYTGIPASYGEREVTSIVDSCQPTCAVVAARGDLIHLELFRRLRLDRPGMGALVVVGETSLGLGEHGYDDLLSMPTAGGPDDPVGPAALAHVGFTSGTTGKPKGVMNTHQTLLAVLRSFLAHTGSDPFGEPPVNLVASPIGHHTGFLWGVLFTAYLDGTAVLLDRWDPRRGATLIQEQGVTTFFGAPTFLQDLVLQDDFHGRLPTLRTVVVAGAPVPRTLVGEAAGAFGAWACPAWGMTEIGIGISSQPGDDDRLRTTDGLAVRGCEVCIVDDAGVEVASTQVGNLEIRGPGLFLGYLGRPDALAESFRVGGWFRTGDLASRDADGYIVLTGRAKDVVIRGGENIPVTAVESLLLEHDGIVDVAVIGVPDDRLGERALAVVVPDAGCRLALADLTAHLVDRGLSKHFLPEGVVVVDHLPRTASGKVRKDMLRRRHRGFFSAGASTARPAPPS